MPLLMITGYPCSGKTTVAEKLKAAFLEKIAKEGIDIKVELVNDERLNIAKESYREAKTEKATRGAQMSAVKKMLSRDTIVILDNMTYIKGFRYQLFCEAKAIRTNSCVVHVGAPAELCKKWNDQLREENEKEGNSIELSKSESKAGEELQEAGSDKKTAWAADLFDALVFRYEEPNGMSRWDSPLYIVAYNDTSLPIDELWETVVLQRPKPPNQATLLKAATPTNYLFELDKITQEIVTSVFELQSVNPGGSVKIKDYPINVELPYKTLSIAQLQRIRRTYIALNKMKNVETTRIPIMFIEYLNKNFERDD